MLQAAYVLWLVFIASWNLAMLWTARAVSRGPFAQRVATLAVYVLGFGLLFSAPAGQSPHFGADRMLPVASRVPLWQVAAVPGWALVAVIVAGLAIAWWARLHIGKLWSGQLTLREDHRVVDSGPYAVVRHPIYTGFITASWGLAVLVATPAALAGAAILTAAMTVKARVEERLLGRELESGSYAAYAARTPMLVPFARG